MHCKRYEPLIGAHVDGTATPEQVEALEAHLAGCGECARELAELSRTRELVRELPELKPSPSLVPALSTKIREQRVGWWERLFWSARPSDMRLPVAVAGALVLCIAVGIFALRPAELPSRVVQVPPTAVYRAPHDAVSTPDAGIVGFPAGGEWVVFDNNDYEALCAATHAAYEEDATFWVTDGVLLTSGGS
jgi:anti-sigma factor RsiW